jgi:hypothetical protein
MANLGEQIARWQTGDKAALMLPAVCDELRRLARIYLSRVRPGHSLQPTELVNEAYMRLVGQRQVDWRNRAHFLEGYANPVSLDAALASVEKDAAVDIMVLVRSMERVAQVVERQAKAVELRVFGGLTVEETAELLSLSASTSTRGWTAARLWLRRELS